MRGEQDSGVIPSGRLHDQPMPREMQEAWDRTAIGQLEELARQWTPINRHLAQLAALTLDEAAARIGKALRVLQH